MKKPYAYNDFHPTARCKHCNRPIKKRLAVVKQRVPEECYLHFIVRRKAESGRRLTPKLRKAAAKRGIVVH